jgi:hypothetical protein
VSAPVERTGSDPDALGRLVNHLVIMRLGTRTSSTAVVRRAARFACRV